MNMIATISAKMPSQIIKTFGEKRSGGPPFPEGGFEGGLGFDILEKS
jgi:hypothetical protein